MTAPDSQREGLVLALHEIIEALDRRGPQIGRAGERRIARDALLLRREAVARLEQLRRGEDGSYDDALVDAIMTDDGGAPEHTDDGVVGPRARRLTAVPGRT